MNYIGIKGILYLIDYLDVVRYFVSFGGDSSRVRGRYVGLLILYGIVWY